MAAGGLSGYVGASPTDTAFVTACEGEAAALVAQYVGTVEVPEAIVTRAVLEVGSELYHRRQAPNGIAQFAAPDGGSAVRVARDPMLGAYPILNRFLGLGIA